jgi:hypothetical protein
MVGGELFTKAAADLRFRGRKAQRDRRDCPHKMRPSVDRCKAVTARSEADDKRSEPLSFGLGTTLAAHLTVDQEIDLVSCFS